MMGNNNDKDPLISLNQLLAVFVWLYEMLMNLFAKEEE